MRRFGALVLASFVVAVLALCVGCSPGSASSGSASSSVAAAVSSSSGTSEVSSGVSTPVAGEVADGTYTVEVALGGGTGKATVESPATLTVSGGVMTATLVWSSPNYDQMVVDGVQYLPVNASGNSTFEVPVAALDEDIAVQAETTAMSEPHMIDYTLRFDSSTLQ